MPDDCFCPACRQHNADGPNEGLLKEEGKSESTLLTTDTQQTGPIAGRKFILSEKRHHNPPKAFEALVEVKPHLY